MDAPSRPLTVQSLSFINAVDHFSGGTDYPHVYLKAKSDYVTTPLDSAGIHDMMAATASVPVGGIVLICDSYGGKISDVASDATAFVHRAGTQYCIQYYSEWQKASDTASHLANVAKVYAAMRPHVPGYSYVNYCDLDLPNYPQAYWGDNLPRLMAVKAAYDPQNLFHHAQSVPLPPAPPPPQV
jgi:FAD/FMN-containing dehydrogenase